MDAARGDVGGDEHRRAGVGELLQSPPARRLRQSAVDRLGLDAGGLEVLGQPVDAELGAGEDDRPAGTAGQLRGDLQLVAEGEAEGQVLGRRGVVAGAPDLVPGRVLEVAADQAVDLAVQRGREQQPLGVAVGLVEQLLDDRQEAQVGHEVGLVEDGDDDLGEGGLALADQVLQAAGGGDDDVDAAAQLLDLAVHRRTAVDGGQLHADRPGRAAPGCRAPAGRARGSARGPDRAGRGGPCLTSAPMRASSGRPKARVLPEPVAALPSTSRPARASGSAEVWMANGWRMPRRSRAVTSGWGRPSWPKVGPGGGLAGRCFRGGGRWTVTSSSRVDSNETGWTTVMRGGAPIQLGARPVEEEGARPSRRPHWRSVAPRYGTRDLHGCAHAQTYRPGG